MRAGLCRSSGLLGATREAAEELGISSRSLLPLSCRSVEFSFRGTPVRQEEALFPASDRHVFATHLWCDRLLARNMRMSDAVDLWASFPRLADPDGARRATPLPGRGLFVAVHVLHAGAESRGRRRVQPDRGGACGTPFSADHRGARVRLADADGRATAPATPHGGQRRGRPRVRAPQAQAGHRSCAASRLSCATPARTAISPRSSIAP